MKKRTIKKLTGIEILKKYPLIPFKNNSNNMNNEISSKKLLLKK